VLFKHLGVDMKDITPTALLKDRKRETEGNPDFFNKDVGPSQLQAVPEIKSGTSSSMNPEVVSAPNSQFPAVSMANITPHVVIN
ncbi:hypothetical protein LINGRAHAP2_LOCUS17882, partial [Linum grandiflorum]